MRRRDVTRVAFVLCVAGIAEACGAGPYGFAREYVPLADEEAYLEDVAEVTYHDVRAEPGDYRDAFLGWFGVVTGLEDGVDGRHVVAASFRVHQPRHLCNDATEASCRVTVSERDSGPFSAVLRLRAEDLSGQDRLWLGSLIKVYGHPTGEVASDGGPVLRGDWYRHWPRGAYVSTGAAESMRR